MQCWHVVSEILRPIGGTAGTIAAIWSGRSPFSLGILEGCLPKLVEKTLSMFGRNTPDDCPRFRKHCRRTSLPIFGGAVSSGWLPSYLALLPKGNGMDQPEFCLPKPCSTPIGGATDPWDAGGDERWTDSGGLTGAWLTVAFP